jgi:hypothetical protein
MAGGQLGTGIGRSTLPSCFLNVDTRQQQQNNIRPGRSEFYLYMEISIDKVEFEVLNYG